MDLCRMILDDILSHLTFLQLGIGKRMQTRQRDSARQPRALERSHTGSRKNASVQTDIHDDQLQTRRLQEALEGKERTLKHLKKIEEVSTKRVQSFQAELEAANGRLEKSEEGRIALQQRAQQAEARLSKAEDRTKALRDTVAQLSSELHQSQSTLEKTAALLDMRSAELHDAQTYLSKLDDVADSEVLQLVNGINSRIFQAMSNIANAFQPRYDEQKDEHWESEEAAAWLRGLLGDDIVLALRSIHRGDEPLVVQIALQAVTASYTRWLCTVWDLQDEKSSCLLQHIYQSIRTERQSIAGRWRALTRAHMRVSSRDSAHWQRIASDMLVNSIIEILLASGVGTPRQDLREELEHSYGNALHEIVHQSLEFQRITGERIISRDIRVAIVDPGCPFDRSVMADEWADPKRAGYGADPHPVLCTTHLGLVREKRVTGKVDGEEGMEELVLLKPQVVLKSLLEELVNEKDRVSCN